MSLPDEVFRPILFVHHPADVDHIGDDRIDVGDVIATVITIIQDTAQVTVSRERLRRLNLFSADWLQQLSVDQSVISGGKLSATDRAQLKTHSKEILAKTAAAIAAARKGVATHDAITVEDAACAYYVMSDPPLGDDATVGRFSRETAHGALTEWARTIKTKAP